jgi:hypothetical protein
LDSTGKKLAIALQISSMQDWGEAPEFGVFYGRTEELATLEQWIVKDRCRLVTLLGMGGIGKTALAVKLAESIQEQFQYVIWRSLRYAPPVEDILAELIQFLSNQKKLDLPAGFSARLSQLIDCLRKQRCLVVLDNFEAILRDGESHPETLRHRPGTYLEGYEAYGELLHRVGESQHQSAIAGNQSRETQGNRRNRRQITTYSLFTAEWVARSRRARNLKSQRVIWRGKVGKLIRLYRGNPLALNIVSTTIRELFNGNVSEFLIQNTLVITGFTDILDQQFKRLSALEKQIVYWLAIHRQPVLLSQLQRDILGSVKKSDLIEGLQSLGRRSLLEKTTEPSEVLFTLPPIVMKYVTNQFVEQVGEQVCEGEIQLLSTHALVTPQEDKSQEFQFKPILLLVKEQLISAFRSENRLIEHLKTILSILEGKPALEVGYAKDNILKLLAELESA